VTARLGAAASLLTGAASLLQIVAAAILLGGCTHPTPATNHQSAADSANATNPANAESAAHPANAANAVTAPVTTAPPQAVHDIVIRGGTIYDGGGGEPFAGDVAIDGDTIAAVGHLLLGRTIVDAYGMSVAPGFVNMLSHAYLSLGKDGRALSDVMQGVTLEVFGETSLHPFGAKMEALAQPGIAVNIAGLVATATARGESMSARSPHPSPVELERMRKVVAQAMDEGALGLTSALIYTPDNAFTTDELVELAKVSAQHGGIYAAHIRNEGNRLVEALQEMVAIGERAGVPVEVYHFKQSGRDNWGKLGEAVRVIEAARQRGVQIGADMYAYEAAATGLDATMPPWVRAGGHNAWFARLRDRAQREKCAREMERNDGDWDNFLAAAGADGVVLAGFHVKALQPLVGKTLAEAAKLRGKTPAETLMDLVVEDGSRGAALYFTMSPANLAREVALPWMAFGSDADAGSPEAPPHTPQHPRAFGNFARVLGHFARDEKSAPLPDIIRRMTSLPASVLHLSRRGQLAAGNYADVVIFDAQHINDGATYQAPNVPAIGVRDVFVNGAPVVRDGAMTTLRPGRFIHRRAP
jgi:N-acyl-D-amino-acid deacylase